MAKVEQLTIRDLRIVNVKEVTVERTIFTMHDQVCDWRISGVFGYDVPFVLVLSRGDYKTYKTLDAACADLLKVGITNFSVKTVLNDLE